MKHEKPALCILVRGSNDVGSAVAHCLFKAGYGVVIHDDPKPASTRRKMSFTDAIFNGEAILDGISAKRVESLSKLEGALISATFVPVWVNDVFRLLEKLRPQILVDARMRKHKRPTRQTHLAQLTLGLGPNFIAGVNVHVAIETARGDDLGRVITSGGTKQLEGEPISIEGHGRERYVYAPLGGKFSTPHQIGDTVIARQEIASINATLLRAPISGVIRGITHNDVPVELKTKVIEIDPRGGNAQISGIGERQVRIAEGVLSAIQHWEAKRVSTAV